MTIDLIILGMLIEKPQSAYDLQKDIEYHNFARWSRISTPSVYKKVIVLQKKQYLKRSVVQGSKLSNKAIYSITDLGLTYFNELMVELSLEKPLVLFDFNVLIANISKLPFNHGLELIQNLKSTLFDALQSYKNWEEEFNDIPFNGKSIIGQQISVYLTLIEWLDSFEKQFIYQNSSESNGKR